MKRSDKKLLFSVVVLSILTLVASAYAETEKIEEAFSASKGGTLIIESDLGAIKVATWDKNEVFVSIKKSARSRKRLDRFEVQIEQRGNDIHIKGDNERNNHVQVEFQVTVPKEYNVDLSTGGGSIDIADINGNVKLNTSGGSIKVGDVNGDLKVNTSGGGIHLGAITGTSSIHTSGGNISVARGGRGINAHTSGGGIIIGPSEGDVNVHTSGGNISIGMTDGNVAADTSGGSVKVAGSEGRIVIKTSGGNLSVDSSGGPVRADTSGGNISIMQARGAIDARTSGGSIEAEMIETDNKKDTHVNLHSSGGSLTVYLPESIEATVSADLKISMFATRDYQIYCDFPLSIKGEESDRISAEGDINGGGNRIQLNTTDGDIYIKKKALK